MVLSFFVFFSYGWEPIQVQKNNYFLEKNFKFKNFLGSQNFVNKVGEIFDVHAEIFDRLGYKKSRMNACGYSLGATFAPNWMDWPMLYTGNPVVLQPGMVFFMHMILMDSENKLAMNLGETYLVTNSGNQRMGKKKLDLVIK